MTSGALLLSDEGGNGAETSWIFCIMGRHWQGESERRIFAPAPVKKNTNHGRTLHMDEEAWRRNVYVW